MPFIILDRDGVINFDSDEYIKSPEEWIPIPGSLEAIAKLTHAGFSVLVATNQSGIARGYYNQAILDSIHAKLKEALLALGGKVEGFFFCPHHPDENCVCRKPKPGLLQQIKEKYQCNFADIFFIGDSHVDIHAALAAGCQPILVLTGKGEVTRAHYPEFATIPCFQNLADAVEYVLSRQTNGHE